MDAATELPNVGGRTLIDEKQKASGQKNMSGEGEKEHVSVILN
jgi:hypothetical protein